MKLFTLELFVDAKLLQMNRLHLAYDVSTHRLPVSPLSYGGGHSRVISQAPKTLRLATQTEFSI